MKLNHLLIICFLCLLIVRVYGGLASVQLLNLAIEPLSTDIPKSLKQVEETTHMNDMANLIRYYDEVLTQSARNYAFTQDMKWKERYLAAVPELDAALMDAIEHGDEQDRSIFRGVDAANIALVEMETQALADVDAGQPEKAVEILESDEYWRQKGVYKAGLDAYVSRSSAKEGAAVSNALETLAASTAQSGALLRQGIQSISFNTSLSIILLIAVGTVLYLSISRPIRKITEDVDGITKGNLEIELKHSSIYEIQQMTDSLNRILASMKLAILRTGMSRGEMGLGEAIDAKNEAEEKYKALYESSSDAIMTIEPPDWNFTSGNPATLKMFNAKNESEFVSMGPGKLSPKYQPDGRLSSEKAKKMIEKAVKDGRNYFNWTHKKITGEEFPATVLLTRVNVGGKTFLQATVRDISESKVPTGLKKKR